ncbi:MAG: AbrB/MazE/SpoVT family DNA-binding domain-containing protein [Candidatus Eisenbacteria bacterium]
MGVNEGDKLLLTKAPGAFRLIPYDPDFEAAMKHAESFMARYSNALGELGK